MDLNIQRVTIKNGLGPPKLAQCLFVFFFFIQHNLCCDNCHSHVAMALNLMRYDNSTSWNMVKLCLLVLLRGKHVR